MHTPQFTKFIVDSLSRHSPPDAEYECIFFGYSKFDLKDTSGSRRWQAAIVRVKLGSAALNSDCNYHFFVADTASTSGAVAGYVPGSLGGATSISGELPGDWAFIYSNGCVEVQVQGECLSPSAPEL